MKMLNELDWNKSNGLLPVIVQDADTQVVLMLGYMNQEALDQTLQTKQVTFFSRSKNALWQKGATSGNTLELVDILADCDQDTILVKANPRGPTCHTGSMTCFGDFKTTDWNFIQTLETIISQRERLRPENSYVAKLYQSGLKRIAQKVGEEGVEVALAAVAENTEELCSEVADLLFHVLILLQSKNLSLSNIIEVLRRRAFD